MKRSVKLPASLMNSLADAEGFDKEAFEKVHANKDQITSIRVNPQKKSEIRNLQSKIPWTDYGSYLNERPSFTFDPLFHAGCYYVQEASSMFLEQAMKQNVDLSQPLKILDLAAAPGGKSTHIQSLISHSGLLVSNEVIRSRAAILQDNIIKWGADNVVVTSNDPKNFAALQNFFDVIVLDAPCSGSGLFRRDGEAINEWSLNNVQLCSQRQQRILADVWPALKENGILIYSTCSYSKEEDEDICDWLMEQYAVGSLHLTVEPNWKIVEVKSKLGAFGYRFWPYKLKGEGFFIACFKKTENGHEFSARIKNKLERLNKKQVELVSRWIRKAEHELINIAGTVYAVPGSLTDNINLLSQKLEVNYFGVKLGELLHEKFIPDHALAMTGLVSDAVEKVTLTYENAIRYLQKKDLPLQGLTKGWKLVTCEGFSLGWINVLPNRINNYYPRSLRILRDI